MSKSPLLLGLSLWLVLGTCTSAVGMKPFLPGIPSSGYRPGLPWENFFRQNAHDGSSDSMDTDETDNDYLVADDASNEDQGYSGPYELYDNMIGGEPNDLLDFQNTDDSDDTSEETDDIDDTDVADYDIDDDIDNYDPDDQNIHDSDFDDLTDIYDNADNTLDDKEDESDQEPLSDHLSGLPVHEEVYNEEPDDDSDESLNRDPRSLKFIPRMIKLGAAAMKGMRARAYLLKGTIKTRQHGITTHYDKMGSKDTMMKDFYFLQPTRISDDIIDGHYVGKIGMVGDRRIHYFLHDAEHVNLKPFLSLQKIDRNGNIVSKDIIHYMD